MRIYLCLLLTFTFTGCGKKMEEASTKASGTVTLDGEPITAGTINFYPEGEGDSAFATISLDGTFQVNTSAGTNGLEPGEYKAVIAYEVPATEDAEGNEVPGVNPIPEKFRNEEKPIIEVSVPPSGTESLDIALTSDD